MTIIKPTPERVRAQAIIDEWKATFDDQWEAEGLSHHDFEQLEELLTQEFAK